MGRVEAFSISGLELLFYSNDHEPPHFHVIRKGVWEIKVDLLATSQYCLGYNVLWAKNRSGGPDARTLRLIQANIIEHRAQLIDEWNRKVCPT